MTDTQKLTLLKAAIDAWKEKIDALYNAPPRKKFAAQQDVRSAEREVIRIRELI